MFKKIYVSYIVLLLFALLFLGIIKNFITYDIIENIDSIRYTSTLCDIYDDSTSPKSELKFKRNDVYVIH